LNPAESISFFYTPWGGGMILLYPLGRRHDSSIPPGEEALFFYTLGSLGRRHDSSVLMAMCNAQK